MRENIRRQGAKWLSGCTSTLDIATVINLSVSAGQVRQLHLQSFPALAVVADGITVANASGAGTLTVNEMINNLNDINETADGIAIGVNKYFSIEVYATMASSDATAGNQSKLFANLPTGVYNSASEAISDASNFGVRTADSEYNNTAFLVARIVLKK